MGPGAECPHLVLPKNAGKRLRILIANAFRIKDTERSGTQAHGKSCRGQLPHPSIPPFPGLGRQKAGTHTFAHTAPKPC